MSGLDVSVRETTVGKTMCVRTAAPVRCAHSGATHVHVQMVSTSKVTNYKEIVRSPVVAPLRRREDVGIGLVRLSDAFPQKRPVGISSYTTT